MASRAEGSYWQHSSANGWVHEGRKIPENREEKEKENIAIDMDVGTTSTEWRQARSYVAVKEKERMEARRNRILKGLRKKLEGIRMQAPLAALKPEAAMSVSLLNLRRIAFERLN